MPEKGIKRARRRQGIELKMPVCHPCFSKVTTDPLAETKKDHPTKIRRPYSLAVRLDLRSAAQIVVTDKWEENERTIRQVLGRAGVEIVHLETLIKEKLNEIEAITSLRNELFNKHLDVKRTLLLREAKTYKARRKEASRITSVPETRDRIFSRDGWLCRVCSSLDSLTIDHVIPVFHGGSNDDSNLSTLCGSCNSKKGAKIEREVARAEVFSGGKS